MGSLEFNNSSNCFFLDGAPVGFSPVELKEMDSIEWWHSINFAPNVSSPGYARGSDFISAYFLDTLDFQGRAVLDIGCWDGFQLFYAEAHGASRLVGIDDVSQRRSDTRGRDFAKRKLKSKVEFFDCNVYDLKPELFGTFDVVMMFGVLYHLIHPMLGIERACSVARERVVLASHFLPSSDPFPWCALYPGAELDGDHTNWSGPNLPWIRHALQLQGFAVVREQRYAPDRITMEAVRTKGHSPLESRIDKVRYG